MVEAVIWLIAFVAILFLCYARWEASVSPGLDKVMPAVMATRGENRLVWSLALAVLGATTLVRPVDILLIVILLGLVGLIGMKLLSWATRKANS
ncbi:hypothetical protein [Halomonas sp.]|uniref:hypothetical protein n=1 Tax=Halomonas sp. TaxID=1486246 RepID=UPI0035686734